MKKIFSALLALLLFAIYTAQSSAVASQFNSYSIFQENLKYLIDWNKSVASSQMKSELTMDDVEAIISRYACQSVAELNKVIDDNLDAVFKTMSDREFKEKTAEEKAVVRGLIQQAWIVAGLAAVASGYTCAGSLVVYSAIGSDYEETNLFYFEDNTTQDRFRQKIITTGAYKDICSKLRSGAWNFNQKYYTMITKSDNIDLYCALRNFSVLVQRVGNKHYNFYIHDIFNFKMEAYDDFMITIVNNWAYLCMFAGVLQEIHVSISFSRSALK